MLTWLRKWWPVGKVIITLAILFFVGRQFYRDLQNPNLWQRPIHLGWLGLAGCLYIFGLGCSALFWYRLLRRLGQDATLMGSLRAYYLGHLGKYLPGKAWALVLRATLVRSAGVRGGVAGMAAFYEVLTTMASGVLLAALLFWFLGEDTSSSFDLALLWRLVRAQDIGTSVVDRKILVFLAVCLLAIIGPPILPLVFNRLVRRISLPFVAPDAPAPPRVHLPALVEGLVLTSCGWLLLAGSLAAIVQALAAQSQPFTWEVWGRYTAYLSLAYVIGFIVLPVPSGLGVREYFLTLFLTPEFASQFGLEHGEARAVAVWTTLLLRFVWTMSEAIIALSLSPWWLPGLVTGVIRPDNGD